MAGLLNGGVVLPSDEHLHGKHLLFKSTCKGDIGVLFRLIVDNSFKDDRVRIW